MAAGIGPSALIVWVLGGVAMFMPLGVCVVYLASRYPDAGGLYAWSRRAFGPFAGFMTGWTYWTGTLTFLPSVLYFTAGSALFAAGRTGVNATPGYFIAFSVVVLVISAVLNVRGLAVAKWLNSAGAVARWLGLLLLVALAPASCWRFGPATPINRHTLAPTFDLADVIFWTSLAFAGPDLRRRRSWEMRSVIRAARSRAP